MKVGAPLAAAWAGLAAAAATAWALFVTSGAHIFHYDARAHLVVARRVLDSLTPGWIQLGAVWLPVPHLLNAVPAQSDFLYSNAVFGSAISAVAFLAALGALGAAVAHVTGDGAAGAVAAALVGLNPGWLYLQSTPLTEPLYLATVTGLVLFALRFRDAERRRDLVLATVFSAAGCLTRYEAWPAAALCAVFLALPPSRAERWRVRPAAAFAAGGLVLPIAAFFLHSWLATGRAFYVMDRRFLVRRPGEVAASLELVADGLLAAFGAPVCALAAAAVLGLAARRRARLLAVTAVFAAPAVVTLCAYLAGHPPKARYALLVAPTLATALAAATAFRRPLQLATAAVLALQPIVIGPPLPVLAEASRTRRSEAALGPGLAVLRQQYEGGRVLASMGSAAPLLFDLGLPLRDIVHEGNGTYWEYAAVDPGRNVSWVLIHPGDSLDQIRAYRPRFPEGFVAVRKIGRFTLYGRAEPPSRAGDRGTTPPPAAPPPPASPPPRTDERHRG